MHLSIRALAWRLPLLLLAPLDAGADIHEHDNDDGLFRFVSVGDLRREIEWTPSTYNVFQRPDIRAPRWTVNITEPDLVTPGFWYTSPFEHIDEHEPGNGWSGPHISDGNGDLIWSGSHISQNWDVVDFRRSNVRGQDLITFLVKREGNGYVLDDSYQIKEKVDLGILGVDFNSHEFHFIENGTRAISIIESRDMATAEQALAVGWEQDCRCIFNGFKEWDTDTWETVFEWSSQNHIGLNESTFLDGGVERGCNDGWGWDYVHLNAVDKDQNGDYYVSARHADTIYKVSKDDGRIIWRLHGWQHQYGDFDMGDVTFSRQHNVRFRGYNGTHELISILDNAKGEDEQQPSHEFSRGLVIALQTNVEPMTARLVSSIDHPFGQGSYAPRRGNYQVLDNGNVFMGWSEQATHSEHTPDGKLIMSAKLKTEWMGTYRSYKYPLVGRPTEPIVAVSAAYESEARNSTTTMVHVSWNGATEVASWRLYKTSESGEPRIHLFSKNKTGFETAMAWDGYASFVIVEALGRDGNVLDSTEVIETIPPPADAMSGAVADELFWLQELRGENEATNPYPARRTTGGDFLLFALGSISTVAILAMLWVAKLKGFDFRRPIPQKYQALNDRESSYDGKKFSSSHESFHDGDSV